MDQIERINLLSRDKYFILLLFLLFFSCNCVLIFFLFFFSCSKWKISHHFSKPYRFFFFFPRTWIICLCLSHYLFIWSTAINACDMFISIFLLSYFFCFILLARPWSSSIFLDHLTESSSVFFISAHFQRTKNLCRAIWNAIIIFNRILFDSSHVSIRKKTSVNLDLFLVLLLII